jgi:protein translocase SecG subunit
MAQILPYIQVALSILLIVGVLLQRSEAGLGSAFGGDGMSGGRYSRRGFEKLLFNSTIVVSILFVLAAFASLFLSR